MSGGIELGLSVLRDTFDRSFAGDPEKAESPTTGQFITHSRSDYRYPRSLQTLNEQGRFEIISKTESGYTRRVHPTHPWDVVGWRGRP